MGDMKTRGPLTPAQTELIQTLIENTVPMTPERLELIFRSDPVLSREEVIAGIAHVFRIAKTAMALVIDDDGDQVQPAIEGESDQYTCAICFATTYDFEDDWHRESCRWAELVEVIKGTPPAD